jgi:transposase
MLTISQLIKYLDKNRLFAIIPTPLKYLLLTLWTIYSIYFIKLNLRKVNTISEIFKILKNTYLSPIQIKEEIFSLLILLNKAKPKTIFRNRNSKRWNFIFIHISS